MRNRTMRGLGILAVLLAFVWATSFAAELPDKSKGGKNTAAKGSATLTWSVLDINNLWTWHRSDGEGNHSPGGEDGMGYPQFTARAVYEDNMVFGGVMYTDAGFTTRAALQPVRVNGGTYLSNHGMIQGWVEGTGATANYTNSTNDPRARIYRIRRDYTDMSAAELTKDASILNEQLSATAATQAMVDAMKDQYAKDWTEWPTQYGAPYIDRNNNGVYDPPPAFSSTFTVDSLIAGNYDEPGVAGADPTTPADQVLYMVYNGLDRSATLKFEGSEPIGLEVQKTVWGYKRTDALGNVYFTRYRLINKGGVDIGGGTKGTFYLDSMFLCQWSDIDLGNAGDDVVGCDSILSMGYVYNGGATDLSYQRFNLPPPSSGYDFLGGPIVPQPGDSAIFDFKKIYGYHNQGMSSFAFFSAGSPYSDPPFEEYDRGTGRWWAMLRGYAPVGGILDAPTPYPYPPGGVQTVFPFSGNPSLPSSATNFIDGQGTSYSFNPGDRRILLNTGPFRMAPNDTQDIYMGFVVGIGGDRLSSVAVMKAYDKACQETFDLVFQVAKAPKNPNVKVTELDGEVLLDWSWDQSTINDTEVKIVQPGAYTFEGYNLFQFPSVGADKSAAVRVATYDVVNNVKTVSDQVFDPVVGQFVLKPVQFGNDNGVTRFVSIKQDYVRDIPKMYNGQEYYFAVTAYSRATLTGYTAALESAPNIITVRPKVPFGKELTAATGDTINVTRTAGASDGSVEAYVADPLSITGDTYEVRFTASGKWGVYNVTKSTWAVDTILTNQKGDANYPVVNGVTIKAIGPPNDAKDFQHVQNPSGAINPPTYVGFSTFNSWGFPDPDPSRGGAPVTDFGGGRWGLEQGGGSDPSYAGFKSRVFRNDNFTRFVPYDFELRFTAAGGKAYMAFTSGSVVNVPFEIWNIGIGTPTDASDDSRMIPWVNDENGDDIYDYTDADHGVSGGTNDPYLDWIYWHEPVPKAPGTAGYDAFAADPAYDAGGAVTGTGPEVMARLVLVNVNGGDVTDPTWPANANSLMPATGNVIRILSTKPNTPADRFRINTSAYAPISNSTLAKASANRVGVFPNPYYTQNGAEADRYAKFVTFNNLPQKATIKIFNLAGHLVRTLEKNDGSQFLAWNLVNSKNFPVASGIYICRVEMPDIGVTKVVKLAVIQEQEILDIF